MLFDLTIWDVFWAVIKIPYFLLIIFIALSVHELGHLLAARLFKIPVEKVKIGSGFLFYERRDKSGTLWCVHAIPFGAHVRIEEAVFLARSYSQRFITIIAAPLVNLILPFFLFLGFYLMIGQPSSPALVAGVQIELPAAKAGLLPGDKIVEINGHAVRNGRDIWAQSYESGAVENTYLVERGGERLEIKVTPLWHEYIDQKGIERAHPRYGIYWWHKRAKLEDILEINGVDVDGDEDKTRRHLIENFDREPLVTLKGPSDERNTYRMTLRAEHNQGLLNPEDEDEYERVYFGRVKGNFYLRQNWVEQAKDAYSYSIEKITKMALLPFQIFPFDPQTIGDEYAVVGKQTRILNIAYDFIHKLSIVSIFIALLNLLPFPYLDGGHIAIQGIEAARKKPLSRRAKARFFAAAFFIFYFSALIANMDNLPRYIDSRMKKLQESIQSLQDQPADDPNEEN